MSRGGSKARAGGPHVPTGFSGSHLKIKLKLKRMDWGRWMGEETFSLNHILVGLKSKALGLDDLPIHLNLTK